MNQGFGFGSGYSSQPTSNIPRSTYTTTEPQMRSQYAPRPTDTSFGSMSNTMGTMGTTQTQTQHNTGTSTMHNMPMTSTNFTSETPTTYTKRLIKEMTTATTNEHVTKRLDFNEPVKENSNYAQFQSPPPKIQPTTLFDKEKEPKVFKSPQPSKVMTKPQTPKFAEPSPIRPNRHVNTEDDQDMRQIFNTLDTSNLDSSSILEQESTVRNKFCELIFWQNPKVSGFVFGLGLLIFALIHFGISILDTTLWTLIAFIAIGSIYNRGIMIYARFQKMFGKPFHPHTAYHFGYKAIDAAVYVEYGIKKFNWICNSIQSLVLCEDLFNSTLVLCLLYGVAKLTTKIGWTTTFFSCWVFCFVYPLIQSPRAIQVVQNLIAENLVKLFSSLRSMSGSETTQE